MSDPFVVIADFLAIALPLVELAEKVKVRHRKDDEPNN